MTKKLFLVSELLLLFALPSWAQDYPKAEVFVGYSYASNEVLLKDEQSNLNGFALNAAYNFHRNLGVAFDFSGHFGDEDIPTGTGTQNIGVDNYTYLAGPRYVFRNNERITPFVHGLFGVQNTRFIGFSEVNFAWAVGGGVDVNVNDHFAIRPAQVEYVGVKFDDNIDFDTTANFRYSGGIVFKF